MKNNIEDDVAQILENSELYEADTELVGIEAEYSMVDSEFQTVSQEIRDATIEDLEFAEEEFGSFIAEIQTEPFNIGDLNMLQDQLEWREDQLAKEAAEKNAQLLRYGTNPFLEIDEFQHTSKLDDRYKNHSEFLEDNRNNFVESSFGDGDLDPRDIGYSGMITSTQLNIQATDLEDAVEKANYVYMMSPFIVAATGNARILEGRDTGYNDLRMPLWERSADTRDNDEFFNDEEPRVGRLDSYFRDMEDYLDRLDHSHDSLQDAIKSNWKDTKIKFYEDNAIVEARPVSMQQSAEDDMAAHAFYIGRLNYAQQNDEELMPINLVNRNRQEAFQEGLEGTMYDFEGNRRSAQDVVIEELQKAEEGLEELNIQAENYLEGLKTQIKDGYAPSKKSAELFYDAGPDASFEDFVQTRSYLESTLKELR